MNILYIGEQSNFYKSLQRELQESTYELIHSKDFNKEIIEKEAVKLIIVDREYETREEKNFLEEYKSHYKKHNTPIFYVSERDELLDRVKLFNSGVDELIDKFDLKSIHLKIDSYLTPDLMWKGINAILVEDDKISAKFISHVLKVKGANVMHFEDALSAFEYIKENPNLDLILTDHVMPNLTGIDFVKKIRNELGLKTIPIVFISSVQDKRETLEFFKSGGNDYIPKPLIKEELYVKVSQLLENRLKSDILKKQIEELEKLDRVKDQFLAVCSHDLRTPLNTILGLSNLIVEEVEDEEIGSYGEQIESSAKELLEMVNDLLDFSEFQLQSNKFVLESVNIVDVFKDCFRKMNSINSKKIIFKVESKSPEVFVSANKSMLIRAFNNILSNAYKFTGEDGEIKGRIWTDSTYCFVSIMDTGIGMPEHYKEKIFQQLSGIGRKGLGGEKSTGLGMSIVKKIIDQHGATIRVDSREGIGTSFTMKFDLEKK